MWEGAFEGGGGRDHRRPGRGDDGHVLRGTVTHDGGVFFIERGGERGMREDDARHRRRRHDADGATGETADPPSSSDGDFESLRGEPLLAERRRQQQQRHTTAATMAATTTATERAGAAPEQQPPGQGGSRLDGRHSLKVLMCGMAAGTVQSLFLCPMEHVKCRLQVDTQRRHRGAVDLCVSIVREHGVLGLNRGMGATLWREAPSFGMYFASYEVVKERVEDLLKGTDVGKAVGGGCGGDCGDRPIPSHAHAYAASALAGGISGALAWLITYPFDVIKTQIQTSPMDGRYANRGTWAVGYELVKMHGWRYMFRGLGVTLAGAVPVNAVIFPTYEYVLLLLEGE
jgi:hypothetical protein